MTDPAFPAVGVSLDGWRLVDEAVETVFEVPTAKVRGATRRYGDERTRTAVREATAGGLDREWRFVAATRLGFHPALPPGTLPRMILPMVRTQARRAFSDRLADRGVEDIRRRGSERVRVEKDVRAQLTHLEATDCVDGRTVPVSGWVGVWADDGDFFVVTGGYPERELAVALDADDPPPLLERSPRDYREEFFGFLRSVH